MEIFVIINGIETTIKAKKSMTFIEIGEVALKQTENYPRPRKPIDEWSMYGDAIQLNMNKTLGEQVDLLQNGNLAFMTIKAGIGA